MAKYQRTVGTASEYSSPAVAWGEPVEIHLQEQTLRFQMKGSQNMLWKVANAFSSWEVKFIPVLWATKILKQLWSSWIQDGN